MWWTKKSVSRLNPALSSEREMSSLMKKFKGKKPKYGAGLMTEGVQHLRTDFLQYHQTLSALWEQHSHGSQRTTNKNSKATWIMQTHLTPNTKENTTEIHIYREQHTQKIFVNVSSPVSLSEIILKHWIMR